MKKHKQRHETPKRKCDRCGDTCRSTEKVSDRIYAGGGHLCPSCLVPAAQERQAALASSTSVQPNMTSPDN